MALFSSSHLAMSWYIPLMLSSTASHVLHTPSLLILEQRWNEAPSTVSAKTVRNLVFAKMSVELVLTSTFFDRGMKQSKREKSREEKSGRRKETKGTRREQEKNLEQENSIYLEQCSVPQYFGSASVSCRSGSSPKSHRGSGYWVPYQLNADPCGPGSRPFYNYVSSGNIKCELSTVLKIFS